MNLVKTSLLNGIAVAVKVASALVLNKILAVYVGPAGYAIIGQFQNAVSVVVSVAGGMASAGVTKATAQYFDDEPKQHAVWRTALRFSLGASLFSAVSLLSIGGWLSDVLLHRPDLHSIFVWLAISLPAMASNNLLLAIVNGKKEIGIYITANIFGSLISLLVTGLLALSFGLYGALVAFTINPAIVLLSTATIVVRRDWFKVRFLWGEISRPALRELSGFCLMGLTTALTMPITYMLIRDHLAVNFGLNAAGYWQAIWKVSDVYLMLVTATLSVYYLPRLAEIRTASELKAEIIKVYSFVMPAVSVGAVTIYLIRDLIIHTLFTPDFAVMRDLFPWQLAGDVIKIGAWVLAYIMQGRAMVRPFVIAEIVFSIAFVASSSMLTGEFGLIGVPMAYTITYSCYWVGTWLLVKRELYRMEPAI